MPRQAPPFPWLPADEDGPISPVIDPRGEVVLLIPEDEPIEAQGTSRVLTAVTTLLSRIRTTTPEEAYRELLRIAAMSVVYAAIMTSFLAVVMLP